MARFLALTSRGLVDVLFDELHELGFEKLERTPFGVSFESNWRGCYLANHLLRTATRVVLPILDFQAYQAQDLYSHLFKKHDFTKYIEPHQTLAIDASSRMSNVFRDQRFVAQKAKDAIVDQFRERFGSRPNVDNDNPDLRVMVRVVKSSVSVAIDTSGESLSFRGYRVKSVAAPLREHLAAGLLRLAEWDQKSPVVDLMCGSGTVLIEAAMAARNLPPGRLRKQYAFERLKNFQADVWSAIKNEHRGGVGRSLPFKFYGFDIHGGAIAAAHANAEKAWVNDLIEFKRQPVELVKRPCPSGIVIVNPPYGERLGDSTSEQDTYRDLAHTLKREFKGWTAWILSGNEELTKALHLKADRRIRLFNGNLECRFLRYPIV